MDKQRLFNVAMAIAVGVALTMAVIVFVDMTTEYQIMSISGYLFSVEDEDGTVQFSISDAGAVNMAGALDFDSTLNVDGAVTLNSTLDVDGNISSGTGAITVTDSVNITGAVDCDSTFNADGAATLNSTLDVDGNISSGTGAITMTDNVEITGTLTLDSVVFSGPVRFGTASSVVTGTTVAHGLATTPTAVVLTPEYNGAFTQTMYVLSTDATSITVGLESGSVTTVTTLHWMAGK